MDDALGAIGFLASSEYRLELLDVLGRAGPMPRRQLQDRVAASRSTVKRCLDAFVERDWVSRRGDTYRLTGLGRVVLDAAREFREAMAVADDVAPVLRWAPGSELDFDVRWLADADVVVPTPGEPYAPAVRQTELQRHTSAFRGLLPTVGIRAVEITHPRILSGELTAELVVTADVAETLREDPYATYVHEQLETGHLRVLVVEDVPFYLGIPADGPIQLGVEDDEGFPRALLETTDAAVREWAEATYGEYREGASPLVPDEVE